MNCFERMPFLHLPATLFSITPGVHQSSMPLASGSILLIISMMFHPFGMSLQEA
jgi:hypothetical protein